jgi:hypothetical protein
MSDRQIDFLKMICEFHLKESQNEAAKKQTQKLLWCLKTAQKTDAIVSHDEFKFDFDNTLKDDNPHERSGE